MVNHKVDTWMQNVMSAENVPSSPMASGMEDVKEEAQLLKGLQ